MLRKHSEAFRSFRKNNNNDNQHCAINSAPALRRLNNRDGDNQNRARKTSSSGPQPQQIQNFGMNDKQHLNDQASTPGKSLIVSEEKMYPVVAFAATNKCASTCVTAAISATPFQSPSYYYCSDISHTVLKSPSYYLCAES